MTAWIPVIGTLVGVLVGGGITILVTIFNMRSQAKLSTQRMVEERSVWVAERQLTQLEEFHQAVDRLLLAVEQMIAWEAWRKRQARADDNRQVAKPPWIPSGADAREAIETALRDASLAVSLIDDDLSNELRSVRAIFAIDYMLSSEGGLAELQKLEAAARGLRAGVAQRYRQRVAARASGADVLEAKPK